MALFGKVDDDDDDDVVHEFSLSGSSVGATAAIRQHDPPSHPSREVSPWGFLSVRVPKTRSSDMVHTFTPN